MRRRALLSSMAVGAAGLAGCVSSSIVDGDGNGAGGTGNESDPDGNGGDTDGNGSAGDENGDPLPDPPEGRSSVIDLETIDRTYALTPTSFRTDDDTRVALWFDRTATDESPARLTGWLRNENEYENTVDLEWLPAVGNTYSRTLSGYDHESRLHLAPTETNEVATTVPEVTQNDDGLWHVADVGPWIQESARLDPGESVRLEYHLVGEPNMPGRPTGTYEFRGNDESVRIAVSETDSPGPEGESKFAGRSVPPIHEDRSIQWYHDANESAPAYLEPATEHLDLDGAIDFELVYNAREASGCGHWNLYKLVEGEWYHVDPLVHTDDCRQIAPGERMEWTLRAFNGPAVDCDCDGNGGCAGGLTRGYLGSGIYGVVAGYGYPAEESGALVELAGDPVEIEPSEDATIERDGAEVVVTADSYGDGEHPPDATLFVERSGGGTGEEEPDRIIPEQLMGGEALVGRSNALRNGVAAFEDGVERVEVRTDEHAVDDAVGYDASSRLLEVRGETYELTAERSGD